MSRRIKVELAPIAEVWKEASCLTPRYSRVSEHQERLRGLAKLVSTMVSFEEVFGPGILERWLESQQPIIQELEPVKPMQLYKAVFIHGRPRDDGGCTAMRAEVYVSASNAEEARETIGRAYPNVVSFESLCHFRRPQLIVIQEELYEPPV